MAFCNKCGTQAEDGVQVCPNCGQAIEAAEQPQAQPPENEQPEYAQPQQPPQPEYAQPQQPPQPEYQPQQQYQPQPEYPPQQYGQQQQYQQPQQQYQQPQQQYQQPQQQYQQYQQYQQAPQYKQGYKTGPGSEFAGFDVPDHKSSLGMDANIAVLVMFIAMVVVSWIPYLGWVAWAAPLVFFLLEKQSVFVKFQAIQALGIAVVRAVISIIMQILIWVTTPTWVDTYNYLVYGRSRTWGAWVVLSVVSYIIGGLITLLQIYIVYKAYNYKQVELPGIASMAENMSQK